MITKYSNFKENDLDILRFVLKQGIVTSKQILKYTNETSLHTVYRRLRKLEAAGLVWKKKLTLRLNVYFPKREARDYLDYPVTVANDTSLYTAEHDLIINDLVLYLKSTVKTDGFEYKTEREYRFELLEDTEGKQEMLQTWNKIRDTLPDVVLLLPNFTIAIEAELHTKSANRLQKKMERYAAELVAGKYTDVWYFVPNQAIANALKRAIDHVARNWMRVSRMAQSPSGKNVFQQIQIRNLPAEVMAGE